MTDMQAERMIEALREIGETLSRLERMLNDIYSPNPNLVQQALRDQYRKYRDNP